MNKVVYVTGFAGFIGSHLTRKLLNKGYYVRGIDKMTYASDWKYKEEFQKYPNFEYDIKDINQLTHLYDCDYFINTAAESHVDNSIANADQFVHSNINGVHHILELIRAKGKYAYPVLMHMSTDEVYGDIITGSHIEDDILKPSNPYSATKAAADMLIKGWARTYDIPYLIVRPTNNYGIGQYVEKLIPRAIKCLNLGRQIPLHNNGTPIRTWLHAQDTADAMVYLMEYGVQNEIYNINGTQVERNIDVVNKIIKLYDDRLNPKDHIDYSVSRQGQDLRYNLNDYKLRSIGWEPKKLLWTELPSIVEHYRDKFIW